MEQPFKQNPVARKCRSCGAQVPSESKFCLKCGHELIDENIPLARTTTKSKLVRSLPWTLPLVLALLFFLSRPLFLSKGNDSQNSIAVAIFILGALALITGVIGLLIQLVRRKGKRVWAGIALGSLVAVFIGMSIGDYVGVSSSDKGSPSTGSPPSTKSTTPNIPATASPTITGGKVELARQTVPATGGTITINKPGDALNGLQITVPSGAYKTSTNFTVSYQNVKSANPNLTASSPLIMVENGGEVADKPMTLKIPLKLGTDDFPMVFDFDLTTGNMEPIPTTALDDNSITVNVDHFSNKLVLTAKGQYLKSQELLDLKKGFTTKFEPGRDDWQLRNRGTFIGPNGVCAGMSMTALWYFTEKSKGVANRLFGQYPGKMGAILEDDRDAWRLVSTVQQDLTLRAPTGSTASLPAFISTQWHDDEVVFRSFELAMIFTGQPQLIGLEGIYKATTKPLEVGHAMIVYGFLPDGLLVADPNDPGSTQHKIKFENGRLGPYETDRDPQNNIARTIYDRFYFAARGGSFVSWEKVGAHWAEFDKKTVGDGRFPDYTLKLTDDRMGQYDIYQDAVTVDRKTISLRVDAAANLGLMLYRDFAWVNGTPQKSITVNLKDGANQIGVFVQGIPTGTDWKWSDFRWINITYKPTSETWAAVLKGTSSGRPFNLGTTAFNVTYNVTATFPQGLVGLIRAKQSNSFPGNAVMDASSTVIGSPGPGYQAFAGSVSKEPMETSIAFDGTWIQFSTKPLTYAVGAVFKVSYQGSAPGSPQVGELVLTLANITETSITGTWETYGNAGAVAKGTFTLTRQ